MCTKIFYDRDGTPVTHKQSLNWRFWPVLSLEARTKPIEKVLQNDWKATKPVFKSAQSTPPHPLCRGKTQSEPYIKTKPSLSMCLVGHCCTRTIVSGARVNELVRRSSLCHRSPVSSFAPPARRSFELHKAEWYVDLTLPPPPTPFPFLRAGGRWGGVGGCRLCALEHRLCGLSIIL